MRETFFDIADFLFSFHSSLWENWESGNKLCAILTQKISHIKRKVGGHFNFLF